MKLSTKKRLAKFAAATAVSAALIVTPSVAAMADATATYTTGGQARATAYWNASSDTMSSTDRYNDGWGSRTAYNLRGNTSNQYVDNIKGAGTTGSQPSTPPRGANGLRSQYGCPPVSVSARDSGPIRSFFAAEGDS